MLPILKDFLTTKNLELRESSDFYEIKLEKALLLETISLISHQSKALFVTAIVIENKDSISLKLFFHLNLQSKILIIETNSFDKSFDSISSYIPIFNIYEERFKESFGIKFNNSNSLISPSDYPQELGHIPNEEEITIVQVGPVHAGVIEPGSFRIQAIGEHIVNLKIDLNFLHRGIEEMLSGRTIEEGLSLSENICGDSSIAYSLAFIQCAEKILNKRIDTEALFTRTILLELERLYNHIGDLGALINDTGYSFANSRLSVIKERVLELNKKLFDHRFLKGNIKLGGLRKILEANELSSLRDQLHSFNKDFHKIINIVNTNPGVIERLKNTGVLTHSSARRLSASGFIGRTSGIFLDSRRNYPFAAYPFIDFHLHGSKVGDVFARYKTRINEVNESFHIINECISKLSDKSKVEIKRTDYDSNYSFSLAESFRGEVFAYLELDAQQKIKCARFKDPSLHNWKALECAVLKNIVPDFPLCNKSFSLAYAGSDL